MYLTSNIKNPSRDLVLNKPNDKLGFLFRIEYLKDYVRNGLFV